MAILQRDDLTLSYQHAGRGLPLVFLHGWPEWSAIWRYNLPQLANDFHVVAPDLRNFGDSIGSPARDVAHYVDDLAALVDHLGFDRFGLVSHDVGAFIAQDYARAHPDRVAGLFFFDCPHFGLGQRWLAKGQVREIWYQSFQQLPLAADLVGLSRASCELYFGHFLRHWASNPNSFDHVLAEWVDNFMKPGRIAGGFRWYAAANERRSKAISGAPPKEAPITVPAISLWGQDDPILRVEWQETLPDVFSDITLQQAPGAGHFVAWEAPALANQAIKDFFIDRR